MSYKFEKGQIVKSTGRTLGHELVLIVLDERDRNSTQFNAAVLVDGSDWEHEPGDHADNWNEGFFKLATILDVIQAEKNILQRKLNDNLPEDCVKGHNEVKFCETRQGIGGECKHCI